MLDIFNHALDDAYATLGVPATLAAGTAGDIDLTVIDYTRRKSSTTNTDSGAVDVSSVGPCAHARMQEILRQGLTRDDLKGSVLTFNGRSWVVRRHELTGSPNGEDYGHVVLMLSPNG